MSWLIDALVLALIGFMLFVGLPTLITLLYFSIEALIEYLARFTKSRR